MQNRFKLSGRATCPDHGESLGQALAAAAYAKEQCIRKAGNGVEYSCHVIAEMLYLAADAYEAGAAASIGHNRADRYEEAARQHRTNAEALLAEGRAQRDAREGAALLAAFDDGYAGRDISRHSFERRKAAQLGQHFASNGMAMPKHVLKVYQPRPLGRDSEPDYLQVDDARFVVSYPDGKLANFVVEVL